MKDSALGVVLFLALAGIGITLGKDNIQTQMSAARTLQAETQATDINHAKLDLLQQQTEAEIQTKAKLRQLEAERVAREDEIALQRYKSNCRVPTNGNGQGIAIAPGMALKDPTTNLDIPDGVLICDSSGNTGVMSGGIVTQFARLYSTTPKQVLDPQGFRRFYKDVQPAAPPQSQSQPQLQFRPQPQPQKQGA